MSDSSLAPFRERAGLVRRASNHWDAIDKDCAATRAVRVNSVLHCIGTATENVGISSLAYVLPNG